MCLGSVVTFLLPSPHGIYLQIVLSALPSVSASLFSPGILVTWLSQHLPFHFLSFSIKWGAQVSWTRVLISTIQCAAPFLPQGENRLNDQTGETDQRNSPMGSVAVGTHGWPRGAGRVVPHCGLSPRGP